MASNFQRGSTPPPGAHITAKNFSDLANGTTAARQTFSLGGPQIGLLGAGGVVLIASTPRGVVLNPAWPWKAYNTTTGSTGQVQINGGDGYVASLNGFVVNVSGDPNNVQIGMPSAFPQLPVTSDGVIYGYAVPTTAGTASPLTSLDVFFAASLPAVDTSNPAGFYPFLIATVTDYATDGMGNVTFSLFNATNYGWTTLIYCGTDGTIQIY